MTAASGGGRLHGVLLAAGNASRYGSAKQRVRIDGVAMVRRAALAMLAAGVEPVVVTGAYADEVAAELAGLPLNLVLNPDWQQGMGGSIACGFRHLLDAAPASVAALICLADQPLVGAAELKTIVDAHREAPQRIIAADYGPALGPPCLFPRSRYPELSRLCGQQGARKLLEKYADEVDRVALPAALVDIDTAADYERLLLSRQRADAAR